MESGVGLQNPLFFIGVIENNVDPRKEGRVQVRAFGVHGTNEQVPSDMLPWAIVVQGNYNPNNVPKVNSWVLGIFLDGRDAQEPMVIGLIPTQYASIIDPKKNGWGAVPPEDGNVLAFGSHPDDVYQPQQSRYLRGEYVQETHVLTQEMGRTTGVKIGGSDRTWDQPAAAFNTEYPKNNVWETAYHSIELDDTGGNERITVRHKSGSFVEIDSRGTTTNKTVGDQYDVMDRNQHVVVGGMSTITVQGNSYVYVKGNKIEEIEGDLQTLVHGNHLISVGGQSTIQAGEQVQVRGMDVKVNANAGTLSINAQKELQLSAGDLTAGQYGAISVKGEKILVDATDKLGLRGNTQVNIQAVAELNTSAVTINQLASVWNAKSTGSTFLSAGANMDLDAAVSVAIGGGVTTDINSPIVNIDDFVNLAGGLARPSTATSVTGVATADFLVPPTGQQPFVPGSAIPEVAWYAGKVVAPEPVAKSTSIMPIHNPSSLGSVGFVSRDHGEGNGNSVDNSTNAADITAALQDAATPLLDLIGNRESDGYDDYSNLISDAQSPPKRLTTMTIQEVLDWQDSIDHLQDSEAAGRYQIMEDTLRGYDNGDRRQQSWPRPRPAGVKGLYEKAGLSAGDLFSPVNQDKMAIYLLNYRGMQRYLNGEMTRDEFINSLANEWAAIPKVTGNSAGDSAYEGIAGNSSRMTIAEIREAVEAVYNRANTDVNDPRREGPQ